MSLSNSYLPSISSLSARFAAWQNNQASSPLFSRIPPEIRNAIFDYVLTVESTPLTTQDIRMPFLGFNQSPAESPSTPDPKRPTHLSHLQTCRMIYLEAHLTPLTTTFYTYKLYDLSLAPVKSLEDAAFFDKMASWQKSHLQQMHIRCINGDYSGDWTYLLSPLRAVKSLFPGGSRVIVLRISVWQPKCIVKVEKRRSAEERRIMEVVMDTLASRLTYFEHLMNLCWNLGRGNFGRRPWRSWML